MDLGRQFGVLLDQRLVLVFHRRDVDHGRVLHLGLRIRAPLELDPDVRQQRQCEKLDPPGGVEEDLALRGSTQYVQNPRAQPQP